MTNQELKAIAQGTFNTQGINQALDTDIKKTGKLDVFKVDVRNIIQEDDFNARKVIPYTLETIVAQVEANENDEDILELALSIKETGLLENLKGYKKRGSELFVLTDGHRRLKAIFYLIATGTPFHVVTMQKSSQKTEDRIIEMLVTGSMKKALKPVELAECFKRLLSLGFNKSEIAKKIGKSHTHVNNLLILAEQSKATKNQVAQGNIKASAVIALAKESDDTETVDEIVTETVDAVKSERGADKTATLKDVKNQKSKKNNTSKKDKPLTFAKKLQAVHDILCTTEAITVFDKLIIALEDKSVKPETIAKMMTKELKEYADKENS